MSFSDKSTGIVVWEVRNELYNGWQMYTADFCQLLENFHAKYLKDPAQESCPALTQNRVFDLKNKVEKDRKTGSEYPIRRLRLPRTNALARGITWEWNAGNKNEDWKPYCSEIIQALNLRYDQDKTRIIDLMKLMPDADLDFTIDFNTMKQTNNRTGVSRSIRKAKLLQAYPLDHEDQAPTTSKQRAFLNDDSDLDNDLHSKPQSSASTPASSPTTVRSNGITNVPKELKNFANAVSDIPVEDCCICMGKLNEASDYDKNVQGYCQVLELIHCKHQFHCLCLKAAMDNSPGTGIMCPYCKKIYGTKKGTQPDGTMTNRVIHHRLSGYSCDTIQITYNFQPGIQGKEHPNPGAPYSAFSFPREAYLPNNKDGQKVLKMLKVAWDRRLIFTIGQSVTSGARDVITWNEIHHKTSMFSGPYGYPDQGYIANVIEELKAQGVTENDI